MQGTLNDEEEIFCLLTPSVRRTLPNFLDGPAIGRELMAQNRFNAIQMLHTLSEKKDIHLQESFVLAWGQVGR